MKSAYLLVVSLFLSILLLYLHLSALKYFFYWTIPWFDIVIHGIGGLIVSFFVLFFVSKFYKFDKKNLFLTLLITSAAVIVISLSWEVFEFMNGLALNRWLGYWSDTISDLSSGLIGSLIGTMIVYIFIDKNE